MMLSELSVPLSKVSTGTLLTIVAELVLINHTRNTLMSNICDPNVSDADVLSLEILIELVPQRLIQFLFVSAAALCCVQIGSVLLGSHLRVRRL